MSLQRFSNRALKTPFATFENVTKVTIAWTMQVFSLLNKNHFIAPSAPPSLLLGEFMLNGAVNFGGAINVEANGRVFVASTDFDENTSRYQGTAIRAAGTSISIIDSSAFNGNLSTFVDGSVIAVGSNVEFHRVTNSTFSD